MLRHDHIVCVCPMTWHASLPRPVYTLSPLILIVSLLPLVSYLICCLVHHHHSLYLLACSRYSINNSHHICLYVHGKGRTPLYCIVLYCIVLFTWSQQFTNISLDTRLYVPIIPLKLLSYAHVCSRQGYSTQLHLSHLLSHESSNFLSNKLRNINSDIFHNPD